MVYGVAVAREVLVLKVGVRLPVDHLIMEGIRLDEEPVLKTGAANYRSEFESLAFRFYVSLKLTPVVASLYMGRVYVNGGGVVAVSRYLTRVYAQENISGFLYLCA